MLDIGKFGDRTPSLLEHEHRKRLERQRLTFELRDDIKRKYIPQRPKDPLVEEKSFLNNSLHTMDQEKSDTSKKIQGIDMDKLVQRIDQRIAKLNQDELSGQTNKPSFGNEKPSETETNTGKEGQ